VVYDKNGKPFTADKHGGVGGNKTAEVSSTVASFLFTISSIYSKKSLLLMTP